MKNFSQQQQEQHNNNNDKNKKENNIAPAGTDKPFLTRGSGTVGSGVDAELGVRSREDFAVPLLDLLSVRTHAPFRTHHNNKTVLQFLGLFPQQRTLACGVMRNAQLKVAPPFLAVEIKQALPVN